MGGALIEDHAPVLTAGDIKAALPMPEQLYTDARVSIDCGHFVYSDSASSCIGRGAFGAVFKGVCTSNDRQVAIKKMARVNVNQNEVKVMKRVQSSFLVSLIDICFADEDDMYIVMELCDADLDSHLKYNSTNGRLEGVNLRLLINGVARGYQALYDQNIVHRDIKPQNILVKYGPEGRDFESVKLSDFGISRFLTDEQDAMLSNVAGTFYYMAPEVGANLLTLSEYDYQADMWSVGVLFYQCIVGRVPFDERALCRLFLYTACGNFEAYDPPELLCGDAGLERLVAGLLQVQAQLRVTPPQLTDAAARCCCCAADAVTSEPPSSVESSSASCSSEFC